MTIKDLPDFSSTSKVWVYQADRSLSEGEVFEINELIKSFTRQWAAHNQALKAWGAILYNRFLILMVDESQTNASGCSIDSSVHFLKELEQRYHLNLFDRLHLAYWDGSEIKIVHRSEIGTCLEKGEIDANTIVFHNMITDKAGLENKWQVPLKESWAGRMVSA